MLTCTSAKDIWDKLCAWFERSSTHWLNMLIEWFFQARRDCKEDICYIHTCVPLLAFSVLV